MNLLLFFCSPSPGQADNLEQTGGTPQILVDKTLRMTSRLRLYTVTYSVILCHCRFFDESLVLLNDAELGRQPLDLHDLQRQPPRGALQRVLRRRRRRRGQLLRRRPQQQGRYSMTSRDSLLLLCDVRFHNSSSIQGLLLLPTVTPDRVTLLRLQ